MDAVKKDYGYVDIKLQKSTDTKQDIKQPASGIEIGTDKVDKIIKLVTSNTLDMKQAVLDIVSDGKMVGSKLDTTIEKAKSVKGDAKKASLQKRADMGEFVGKLFESIKNIWNGFGNALNMFVQTLTKKQETIQKSADNIKAALEGVK